MPAQEDLKFSKFVGVHGIGTLIIKWLPENM